MEINLNDWKTLYSITELISIEGTVKSIEVRNYDNARLNIMFILYYNEEVRQLRGLLLVTLFARNFFSSTHRKGNTALYI